MVNVVFRRVTRKNRRVVKFPMRFKSMDELVYFMTEHPFEIDQEDSNWTQDQVKMFNKKALRFLMKSANRRFHC